MWGGATLAELNTRASRNIRRSRRRRRLHRRRLHHCNKPLRLRDHPSRATFRSRAPAAHRVFSAVASVRSISVRGERAIRIRPLRVSSRFSASISRVASIICSPTRPALQRSLWRLALASLCTSIRHSPTLAANVARRPNATAAPAACSAFARVHRPQSPTLASAAFRKAAKATAAAAMEARRSRQAASNLRRRRQRRRLQPLVCLAIAAMRLQSKFARVAPLVERSPPTLRIAFAKRDSRQTRPATACRSFWPQRKKVSARARSRHSFANKQPFAELAGARCTSTTTPKYADERCSGGSICVHKHCLCTEDTIADGRGGCARRATTTTTKTTTTAAAATAIETPLKRRTLPLHSYCASSDECAPPAFCLDRRCSCAPGSATTGDSCLFARSAGLSSLANSRRATREKV